MFYAWKLRHSTNIRGWGPTTPTAAYALEWQRGGGQQIGTSRQTRLNSDWTGRRLLPFDWLAGCQGPAFFQQRHIPSPTRTGLLLLLLQGCWKFPNIWWDTFLFIFIYFINIIIIVVVLLKYFPMLRLINKRADTDSTHH